MRPDPRPLAVLTLAVLSPACTGPESAQVSSAGGAATLEIESTTASLRAPADDAVSMLGYREERSGGRAVFVRTSALGERIEIEAGAFEGRVRDSVERMAAELPSACREWLRRCPELAGEVASLLEAGAVYRGAARSDTVVAGADFWSRSRAREVERKCGGPREVEDPIDTLVAFLAAALDAADTARSRADRHEDSVERAARLIERSAGCIGLDRWPAEFGTDFRTWNALAGAHAE